MYLISSPEIRPQKQPLIFNGAPKTRRIKCIPARAVTTNRPQNRAPAQPQL